MIIIETEQMWIIAYCILQAMQLARTALCHLPVLVFVFPILERLWLC